VALHANSCKWKDRISSGSGTRSWYAAAETGILEWPNYDSDIREEY
jgi:hypothetical protein